MIEDKIVCGDFFSVSDKNRKTWGKDYFSNICLAPPTFAWYAQHLATEQERKKQNNVNKNTNYNNNNHKQINKNVERTEWYKRNKMKV